jgi:hypothetical protein
MAGQSASQPASQPASDAHGNTGIQNVAKSWDGCFPWPRAPFLVCSAGKDAASELIMHAAAPVFVLLFVFPFFLSLFCFFLPLCLTFSPCPFSLASPIRFPFLFLFPRVFSCLSCCLLFFNSFLHFFYLSHFCVSLCRSEHKNDKQNRHTKLKYSKKEQITEYSAVQ